MNNGKKRPIRILQVVAEGMYRAGLETWIMHVLRNIDPERFRMDFVVETRDKAHYDDEIRALGGRIFVCPPRRRLVSYARSFRRVLLNHGPYDVVHSHHQHYSGYVLGLASQAGVPVRIAHCHSDSSSVDRQRGLLWQTYVNLMRWRIRRGATIGLAASRKAAVALFGPSWEADPRWQIFHCGIDTGPFRAAVEPEVVKAELGIPWDAFVIGHVGRLEDPKNHVFLVDVASEVAKREPKTYLLLVGEGTLRPTIERHAARSGIADRVVFAGLRSDVPRLMRGAMDAFVFPSLYEGLPLVTLEAQAAGLPVIIADSVTDEVDVVQPLIRRLSLSQPASFWAETTLASRASVPHVVRHEAVNSVERSDFAIASSVKELENVYLG